MTLPAIVVRDVRKRYRRHGHRRHFATFKSALLSGRLLEHLRPDETVTALDGVSFELPRGRTLGVVGRNGSGKSTLLKLLAGIGKPTAGTVEVSGRVSALIELGAGFHPEISGRENVFINGMMLGLSRRDVAARFEQIVRFAELADFIDAPVKTYSSGMYMRLGFSVAIHVDPDVLLIDEVLAVGDESFTHKCLDRLAEFRRSGRTIVLVTHALNMVIRLCDQAIWIDGGLVRAEGDPQRVVDAYLLDVARQEEDAMTVAEAGWPHSGRQTARAAQSSEKPPDMSEAPEGRWGSREAEICEVELLRDGRPSHLFTSGEPMEISLRVRAEHPVHDVVVGVGVFSAAGVSCYGTNTLIEGAAPGTLHGDGQVRFSIPKLDLVEGSYKIDVALHRGNGAPYDYHRQLYVFRVNSPIKDVGIYRPAHRWTFSGGIQIDGPED